VLYFETFLSFFLIWPFLVLGLVGWWVGVCVWVWGFGFVLGCGGGGGGGREACCTITNPCKTLIELGCHRIFRMHSDDCLGEASKCV